MDLDQITSPPDGNDKQRNPIFNGCGCLWFVETSYHYISPRGFLEHIKFVIGLPGAFIRYRRSMAQSTHPHNN